MTRFASLATICMLAGVALLWGLAAWPDTPDGWLHLQRVRAVAEALQAGVLYPRWFPDFSFGYGYPVLNYYAPGFYYPPALLALAGVDVTTAVRLTLALLFAVSGVGMYALLRLWADVAPALVGVVLFLVFPYRLYDLFVRGALPEFAAFLWLPLILYFTVRAALPEAWRTGPDAGEWKGVEQGAATGSLVAAALCWAGLILTHNLTALMAGLTAVVVLPVIALLHTEPGTRLAGYLRKLMRLAWIVLAPLVLGALVTAWYWAPALLEARWVGIGAGTETAGYANHFADRRDLFTWALIFPYPSAAAPTVPLPAWLMVVVALAVVGLAWRKDKGLIPVLVSGLVAVVWAVWLTTASSGFVWRALEPVLGKLQFPWRWQAIAGAGLALLVAVGWQAVGRRRQVGQVGHGKKRQVGDMTCMAAALAVAAYLVVYATLGLSVQPASGSAADISTAGMWAFDSQNGQVGASWTGEFLPTTVTEQRWAIGRAPSDGSSAAALPRVEMRARPEQAGYESADFQVAFAQPGSLILHQFFFPAWRVLVDGLQVPVRFEGTLGLLAVDVDAGEHKVEVIWGVTTAVWIGRVLTAAGWAAILSLLVLAGKKRSTKDTKGTKESGGTEGIAWQLAIGAWVLAGVLLLVGASGVTARVVSPIAVGADFGTVRLEAVETELAQAGSEAQVQLYWSIQGPVEPLVAFVHVVDGSGTVVAQNDGPLGGEYSPVERWLPGLVMANTHSIALPAGLPPGQYALKAGVYRPGQADAPLVAAGTHDTSVDVGTLEVQS